MQGLASHIIYSMFLLIMVFLVVTNFKGFTAIMKQTGSTLTQVTKALQGR